MVAIPIFLAKDLLPALFVLMIMSSSSNTTTTALGRVAVVTGANKGIGYYIAYHLGHSKLFQHVVLACRDVGRGKEAVDKLSKELSSSGDGENTIYSCEPFTLGDPTSHANFVKKMQDNFGKVDVLVNNAAFAFKNADPTPFQEQCKPTLDINFRATVDFTERMIPLLQKGTDPRIVNVASMAGRLGQVSEPLQQQLSAPDLTMSQLHNLVNDFESSVLDGTHRSKGWGNSNYGMSKLAVIAATRIWAREYHGAISVNCCCPGYCKTDMTSQNGLRDPKEGARNAVIPATMDHPPTGAFFSNYEVANW